GRRGSCRPRTTARRGTPSGRRRATATRKPRRCWGGSPSCRRLRRCRSTSRAAGRKRVMLKVAIVGCGKIADSHASQIQRVKGCEIVAACDREPLMAKQLFERFPIKRWYEDLGRLLDEAKPDVVHITTPPQGHYAIARQCL